MKNATETMRDLHQREADERSVHAFMRRFVERWTSDMDKRDAAEFQADLTLVLQAVHRDATRDTHALLVKALSAMPPQPIMIKTPSQG